MVPVGAQMRIHMFGLVVHYKIDAGGHYVNGPLPGIRPNQVKAVKQALKKAAKGGGMEPSYSGTGSDYVKLTITTDPMTPDRFMVGIGDVPIGWGLIDPAYEINSSDEGVQAGDETGAGTGTGDADLTEHDVKAAGDASDPTKGPIPADLIPGAVLDPPDAATNLPETVAEGTPHVEPGDGPDEDEDED